MQKDTSHQQIHQAVMDFDRALRRPVLQRLNLDGMRVILNELERFHHTAEQHETESGKLDYLVAAGCRVSSDLNEAMIDRLIDTLQSHEADIERLSEQLKKRLQQRQMAAGLLQKAQAIRNQTQKNADATGLGVIL